MPDLCPGAATVHRGIVTGGDERDLCESDEVAWILQPDALAATVVAPVRIEMSAIAVPAGEATSYTFRLETASSAGGEGGVVLRIEIFNFRTNRFEGAVFPNIPESDTVFEVVRETNAGDYIDAQTAEVRTQVSYLRPAGVPPFWTISIDEAAWAIE